MTPIAHHHEDEDAGWPPDNDGWLVGVLAEEWHAAHLAEPELEHAVPDSRFRHSNSGKCARQIGYADAGIPASNQHDVTDAWNMTLGTHFHDWWQAALQRKYPDAEIEVTSVTQGADGSGHIDAVLRMANGKVVAAELKSEGGFGYKKAIGIMQKGKIAEGPKNGHVMQACMNGLGVDADEVVIAYLSKEAVSVGMAKSHSLPTPLHRVNAQWTLTREEYEPIAVKEAKRIDAIQRMITEEKKLPPRHVPVDMPSRSEITDPGTGRWTLVEDGQEIDSGSSWMCDYCDWRTLCKRVGAGRVTVATAVQISQEMSGPDDPFEGLDEASLFDPAEGTA